MILRRILAQSLTAAFVLPLLAAPVEGVVHILPAASVCNIPARSEPILLRSTEKGDEFSILMPAQPTTLVTRFEIRLKRDAVIDEDRTFAAYADQAVFLVRVLKTSNPKKTLDAIAASHESDDKSGVKVSSQDIALGNFKGKQVEVSDVSDDYKERYFSRIQYFATKRQVYAISASARDGSNPSISQFFSTLKLGGMVYDADGSDHDKVGKADTPNMVSAQPPRADQIYKPEEVTRKAVFVWTPVAPFMQVPREINFSTGLIKLQMVLSATGQITDVKVLKGLTRNMNEKVIEGVKYFKFIPAEKDGQPVSQWYTFEYSFNPSC